MKKIILIRDGEVNFDNLKIKANLNNFSESNDLIQNSNIIVYFKKFNYIFLLLKFQTFLVLFYLSLIVLA